MKPNTGIQRLDEGISALHHPGVLIVTRLIEQANEVAKTINDLTGETLIRNETQEQRSAPYWMKKLNEDEQSLYRVEGQVQRQAPYFKVARTVGPDEKGLHLMPTPGERRMSVHQQAHCEDPHS